MPAAEFRFLLLFSLDIGCSPETEFSVGLVLEMGTYQVQTNFFVQTMKTSTWAIISTYKGRGAERWEGGFAKVWLPIQRRV